MTSEIGWLIGGYISTSGGQEYAVAVGLVDDTTLSSAGKVQFGGWGGGGQGLGVGGGGTVGFGGDVGQSVALAALSVSAASFMAPALSVVGNLSVTTSGGGIAQSGAFNVGGVATFDAGTGNVTLANAGNDFAGAVDITGNAVAITDANALTLGTVTADQLTATSTGRLDLGTTDVSGALLATSNGGAIEQGGALQVGGTTELDASTGDVTLANAGNDFGGAVDVTGGAISLRDMNDLTVASLANGANQEVTLVAGGALDLVGGAAIDKGTADLALQWGAMMTTTSSERKSTRMNSSH